jgi:hypothetical protein
VRLSKPPLVTSVEGAPPPPAGLGAGGGKRSAVTSPYACRALTPIPEGSRGIDLLVGSKMHSSEERKKPSLLQENIERLEAFSRCVNIPPRHPRAV